MSKEEDFFDRGTEKRWMIAIDQSFCLSTIIGGPYQWIISKQSHLQRISSV